MFTKQQVLKKNGVYLTDLISSSTMGAIEAAMDDYKKQPNELKLPVPAIQFSKEICDYIRATHAHIDPDFYLLSSGEWVRLIEEEPKPIITDEEIKDIAGILWDRWALEYEGRICMTKDLFTLAIHDDKLKLLLNSTDNHDKWISAQDGLPEPFDYALVYLGTTVFKGRRYSNGWTIFFADGERTILDNNEGRIVTHWMNLPTPPKQ